MFDLTLGQSDDGAVALSKSARNLHMQVVGLSGQGKSFFLEHMIRQDVRNGAGVCVIDPHGDMYDHLVDWLAKHRMQIGRKIHLIHLAEGKWSVGFNPLARTHMPVGVRVGMMLDAFQVVWGDEESGGHKSLAWLLRLVFRTVAQAGLSVREARLIVGMSYAPARRELVARLNDAELIDGWAEFDARPEKERATQVMAVLNRLRALDETPVIQSMLAETKHVLNFTTCMQRGDIVLVNLAHKDKIEPQAAQVLGALITADMFLAAFAREEYEAQAQPFYAYIDECGEYLNLSIVKALDQTRKYGLHYVLAHQRLAQLGDHRSDPIRKGVMGGAQTKAVFLQEDEEDTDELGMLLFGKEFDFEIPKESLNKPVVVGYDRDTVRGISASEGHSTGQAKGKGAGLGVSAGTAIADTDNPIPVMTTGEISSENAFSTNQSSRSYARTESEQEVLVPILEERVMAVHTKEELRHFAAMEVRMLKPRTGYLYSAETRKAHRFTTPDVEIAVPTVRQINDFYAKVTKEDTCRLTAELEAEVVERREAFIFGPDVIDDDDQFRQRLDK